MMPDKSDSDLKKSDHKVGDAASRVPRRKVYYSAVLHIRELTIRCRVRDLSETGALVETTIPLWSGAPCHIALPKLGDAHGTLVWADGPRSGMHFDPPLLASQLAMLTAPVKSARVDIQHAETLRPKTKDAAAEISHERARNAVSWLRSKGTQR
jgi:predicted RNA-binding Zn ribbon-like protein